MIIAATHAPRFSGPNYPDPGHTPEGFAELEKARQKIANIFSPGKYLVAEGTGLRFHEVAACVALDLELGGRIACCTCPMLGGPEAIDKATNMIILPSGIAVPKDKYLALTRTKSFRPIVLLEELWQIAGENGCEHLFLCTGGAFMNALLRAYKRSKEIRLEKGAVYQICPVPGGGIMRIA